MKLWRVKLFSFQLATSGKEERSRNDDPTTAKAAAATEQLLTAVPERNSLIYHSSLFEVSLPFLRQVDNVRFQSCWTNAAGSFTKGVKISAELRKSVANAVFF